MYLWRLTETLRRGTIEGENFSATTSSRIDQNGASLNVVGSEGGNLDIFRNAGESGRDISDSTASETEFIGETQRTGDGGFRTDLESDAGGAAAIRRDDGNRSFAGQSAEGDLYAGHNGNVYKKTDDGWSQYGDGGRSTSEQLERQYGSDRASGQSKSQTYNNQLNRQYDARQSGQRNYNNFQTQRSFGQNSRQRSGGCRRR